MKKNKAAVRVASIVMAAALAACVVGCSSSGTTSGSESDDSGATSTAASSLTSTDGSLITMAEYIQAYPLEGSTYAQSRMAGIYEGLYTEFVYTMGMEDVPLWCAGCHAKESFNTFVEEYGVEALFDTEGVAGYYTASGDYEVNWGNCTNCHEGDPGDGVVTGTNSYVISDTIPSALEYVPEEDLVCGQCHTLYHSYTNEAIGLGSLDFYQYGTGVENIMQSLLEYIDLYGDYLIYVNDNYVLELFQGSNHQSMGLTCTDCHMVETTTEDGETYTDHNMTASPLENETALEFCLTCHEAQGIEDTDAMVEFVEEKIDELSVRQHVTYANLTALGEAVTAATDEATLDEATLEEVNELYLKAKIYYYYQHYGDYYSDLQHYDSGYSAVHNYDGSVECLDAADECIAEANALLS